MAKSPYSDLLGALQGAHEQISKGLRKQFPTVEAQLDFLRRQYPAKPESELRPIAEYMHKHIWMNPGETCGNPGCMDCYDDTDIDDDHC